MIDDLPDMPAMTLMMILGLMHKGDGTYPAGGSLEFARAIERRYLDLGGEIHYNSHVERNLVEAGPADGAEGAVFYIMTGFHAFHVLTGVILLYVVYQNGRRDLYTPERHWAVEAAATYWHFVDVVWIFFYPALYLMGTVA